MSKEGIKKIVIIDYYLILGEVIFGLIVVYFFPQVPLQLIFYLALINLIINTSTYLFLCQHQAPLFFMQAFVLLEMIAATASVTAFFHYFTDIRPILMILGYVPIILFSTHLNALYGFATILSTILVYFALYSMEFTNFWPISSKVLENTFSPYWSQTSIFALVTVFIIGSLIVVLKLQKERKAN